MCFVLAPVNVAALDVSQVDASGDVLYGVALEDTAVLLDHACCHAEEVLYAEADGDYASIQSIPTWCRQWGCLWGDWHTSGFSVSADRVGCVHFRLLRRTCPQCRASQADMEQTHISSHSWRTTFTNVSFRTETCSTCGQSRTWSNAGVTYH